MAETRGIYGYAVQSELALPRLRQGEMPRGRIVIERSAGGLLEQPAEILQVVEDGRGGFSFAVAHAAPALVCWCAATGGYRVEAQPGRIWAEAHGEAVDCEDRLLNALIPLLLIERGELMLHAGAVMTGSGAVVVAGPSRRGKSSLVAALARHGCQVLAEDSAAVSCDEGRWRLWPGPSGVRLDARSAAVLGAEGAEARMVRGKRVHAAGPGPEAGGATNVAAVVHLEPRGGERLELSRVHGAGALAAIFPSVYRVRRDDLPSAFAQAGELVRQVPCFTARLPDDLGRLSENSLELLSRLGMMRPGLRAA